MKTFLFRMMVSLLGLILCVSLALSQNQVARMNVGVVGGGVAAAVPCTNARDAYVQSGTVTAVFINASFKYVGYSFTAGGYGGTWSGTKTACSVTVNLLRIGSPTGTLSACIYSGNTNPTTLIGTCSTNTVNYSDVGTGITSISFTGLSATLTAETIYWVVIIGSANGSSGNTIASGLSGYNEGSPHITKSSNDGTTWGGDLSAFRTGSFTLYTSD